MPGQTPRWPSVASADRRFLVLAAAPRRLWSGGEVAPQLNASLWRKASDGFDLAAAAVGEDEICFPAARKITDGLNGSEKL